MTDTTTHATPDTTAHQGADGKTARSRWERPALIGLLLATAVLYIWGLSASGWANSYYSAAVQAGSESWKAFFFGSFDAANAITVDKPPAALWVMALSVRLFGLSSWSILIPQALMGVASVGVLYATIRRWFTPEAALLSGLALAVTPVALLMFRFNNPDALLVLLMTLAAYATVRALERASTKWLVLVGVLIGFAFLTKMLQALIVVPAFALVYLIAAPTSLRRRIGQLLLAGLGLVASAGWWIAIVELIPARYRPYIGGSQNNSILELTLGYNGLGRITGNEVGAVGRTGPNLGGGGNGGPKLFGPGGQMADLQQSGWSRMFSGEIGGQIAWLLPAALLFLVVAFWLTRKRPRTDRTRAAYLLWGGWLLITGAVFSFMQGIFHSYYTVALAPAVAAIAGMGAVWLWRLRSRVWAVLTLAVAIAGTAVWSYVVLARSPDFQPWLRYVVLVVGLASAVALVCAKWLPRPVWKIAVACGAAAALLGPISYSLETISTGRSGAIITAGPATGVFAGGMRGLPPNATVQDGGQVPSQTGGPGQLQPGRGTPGQPPTSGESNLGGLLEGSTPSEKLIDLLSANADDYTWVAAAVGSNQASGYQLGTGEPVMAIGGFNGSDPSPTVERFEEYVEAGEIHYFIGGSGPRPDSGSNNGAQIAEWVEQNFTPITIDGTTLYDLSEGGTNGA